MKHLISFAVICAFFVCSTPRGASAEMLLELIGSDFTIEPARAVNDPPWPPYEGTPLLIWAELTNNGPEVFEATGPGGGGGHSQGTSPMWSEFPFELYDPDADPNDPLVTTPLGFRGVRLEPGESFVMPLMRLWGIDIGGEPPFYSSLIGGYATFYDVNMGFWDGFDRNPADPFDLEDIVLPLDTTFTVNVIPEPSTFILALFGGGVVAIRRGYIPLHSA